MADDKHGDYIGRSAAVLAVTIVMISLSSLFVCLRMLSRGLIVKNVMPDDWIMMVAWIIAVGLSFTICYGTAWGLGRHEYDLPDSWENTLVRTNYAFSVLYQPALMATKTSILAFYLTLSKANQVFRWACIAIFVVVNAGGLALTFVTVFQCNPVGAVFDLVFKDDAKCTDILTIYLASVPLNLITDLAILFLPMPILTGMRLPKKQKIILVVTFGFGIFVAAIDVVRISYLQSAAETRLAEVQSIAAAGSVRNAESIDSSWYLSLSFMWSAVEVNVGIMCACVPGLKPLVAKFMPSMLRSDGDVASRFESYSEPKQGMRNVSLPTVPEATHRATSDDEGPIGMLDFLTTPDMDELPPHQLERSATALTNTTRHTRPPEPAFFDFADMQQKKSLVHMTNRQSIFPISVVTILFFVWGFEYGLLAELNKEFQEFASVTPARSTGIHSAYYAGYAVGPMLIGRPVLRNWGFKACFPIGLAIYAAGLLIFWPAAVLTSWPTFIVTNFIVGIGLSVLEVSANPWICLCGPARYAEIRLNICQGVQAVGSVVAPLIADKSFLRHSAHGLVSTQWAYLGISLATVLLAVAYYYIPLPEATDSELEDASERIDGAYRARFGKIRVIWFVLALGASSQFCYVGGQEVNATEWGAYLAAVAPQFNSANYLAIAHTAFAVSRFLSAALGLLLTPRIQLLIFYCGAIVFQVLAMNLVGGTGVAMLTVVYFMEGPLFSLIFAQSLRGLGKHTKLGSVFVTTAIGSGAVFAPIANHISDRTTPGVPYSLVVAVAAFAAGTLLPIGLNVMPEVRRLVDPLRTQDVASRPSSRSSRASRALTFFAFGKKFQSRRESTIVEHREREKSNSS